MGDSLSTWSAALLETSLVLVDEPAKRRPTSDTDRPKFHQIQATLTPLVLADEGLRAPYRLGEVTLSESRAITNIA